jgi:hypothetical protein
VSDLAQVVAVLGNIAGMTVFNDGVVYGKLTRNRTTTAIPFAEIGQTQDFREHDSDSRLERVSVDGAITCFWRRDNPLQYRNALLGVFAGEDQMHLDIGAVNLQSRLLTIPFTVSFWREVAKS